MISTLIPDAVGGGVGNRLMAALARAPELVDSARRAAQHRLPRHRPVRVRRRGAGIPRRVRRRDARRDAVQGARGVLPNFETLDKYAVLDAFERIPTTILCGTKDLLTSVGHSRKMAKRIPGARLVEATGAEGHMVILERFEGQRRASGLPGPGRGPGRRMIEVTQVGPEQAEDVVAVVHAGFSPRGARPAPSSAPDETVDSVAKALAEHGGLLASLELGPVQALIFDPHDDVMGLLRRVSVHPDAQGRGVARALVRHAEQVAATRGHDATRVLARTELPRTLRFWQRLGYVEADRDEPLVSLVKVLPVEVGARSADEARALGARLTEALPPR